MFLYETPKNNEEESNEDNMRTNVLKSPSMILLLLVAAVGFVMILPYSADWITEIGLAESIDLLDVKSASPDPDDKCGFDPRDPQLTRAEWNQLNTKMEDMSPPAQGMMFASGDHYELYRFLSTDLGFRPPKDSIDIWRFAEELLCGGHYE